MSLLPTTRVVFLDTPIGEPLVSARLGTLNAIGGVKLAVVLLTGIHVLGNAGVLGGEVCRQQTKHMRDCCPHVE